jgi:iron-sulfur cluster assembly protein
MITVTKEAAAQIQLSAKQSQAEGLPLRVACQRNDKGGLNYALGFADVEHDEDMHFNSEGIEIVVAPTSLDLVSNMVIDYVELDSGEKDFIFKNPNDPNFAPPQG